MYNIDIIYNICINLSSKDVPNLLSCNRLLLSLRTSELYWRILNYQLIDLQFENYDLSLKLDYFKLYRELYPFQLKGRYSELSLIEINKIFIKSFDLKSIELLIFTLNRGIIPRNKYLKQLKLLINECQTDLFIIMIRYYNLHTNRTNDNINEYLIDFIINCLSKSITIPYDFPVITDNSNIINFLIKNENSVIQINNQVKFIFDLDILKRINSPIVLRYYLEGISSFKCDQYLLKLRDLTKLEIIIKSPNLILDNPELILYHLLNLSHSLLFMYLLNKTKKISTLLFSKIKNRKSTQLLEYLKENFDLKKNYLEKK